MQSVDIEDIGNQSSTLLQFNVTDIASFASDRVLCARFLPLILEDRLLRQQRRARYVGHGQLQHDFDPYDKLRGDVLEQHWRSELCRRNKCECNEPETPWLKFLDKLEQLPAGKSMVAAEVELAACPLLQPADSTAGGSLVAGITLNGRADFIEVFWEEPQVGASCKCPLRPVLRIHECKASGQVQASHRLQATLYLLILERLVHEAKGLRFQGQQAFAPKDVRLECTVVLGTVVSGEEVKDPEEVPIKEKEIKALRSSMTPILQRGSHHLARVLAMHEESRNGGASNPLAEPRLPFQLGRQCTSCKAQARCWAQCAEGDGEIQLSGCTSGQAVQLQDGGVKTLLDLKQTCLEDVCTILGQDKQQQQPGSLDAESLKVMAEVRSGRVETVGELGVTSHTEVLLKPRVGPSKLPLESLSLYHVSTSVLSTSSISTSAGSVAGLAALIKRGQTEETLFVQLAGEAQPHISNSSSSGSSSRQGAPQHHKRSAMVHPSTGPAGRGTILSATNRGGAHPAARCGESAAGQEQQAAAEKESGLLQSFAEWLVASIEDASAAEEAAFHFYFHSKKQVHVLVSRCIQLANELQVNSKPWQLLMLLPQLLGQRFGVLGEQQMHSVLEEELSRFATKWEGRALVTATQQRWTPGKAPFIWSGIQWPLPGAQAPGPVQTKILSDDVPPTVLQLHFHPSKSSSSSIQQHYLHGDLGELYSAAATGDSLQRQLECSVRAVDWLRDSMTRAEDSNNWGTGSSSQDRRAVSAMPTAKGPLRREKGSTLLGGPKAPEDDVSAADELTRAMAEAARLERVTAIYGFCIERICCSTPQQRAGSNPEVCEIAEVQQTAGHRADSALSAWPCLRGSQLHTRLRLREGDSVMVTLCSGGTNRCQAAADVLSCCVPMQVVSMCSCLDQTLRCVELKEDAFVMSSAGRSSFSAVNQPYFLWSACRVDSFPQGATVVVEKADINIGGYLCKRVCERLRKPAQCQPAAQMLLLPLQSSPSGSAVGSAPVSTVSDLGICQELRPEQEQLVTCCRQSRPRLHMLQGPPGTGKTETMACAVIAVALDAVTKGQAMIIYVSAITRPAVDGLMTRIERRQAEASCSQKHNLIVDSIESLKKRDCAECRSRQLGRINQATFASSCCGTHLKMSTPKVHVLAGTPNDILKLNEKDLKMQKTNGRLGGASWLVVDEASQMPVPVLLALASLTHPSEGHVLAGGDHRQLACINAYDDASADLRPSFVRHLPFHTAYDYLLELHARAGSARVTVSRLSFSHRLNPVVRHLVSPIYEEDGITLSGRNPDPNEPGAESGRTLDEVLCAIWEADEGLFLLVHNNEGCMKQNALEARLIRQLLDQGAQFGHVSPKDVGIITPHKLQAEELRRQLQPRCSGSKAGRGLDSIEASTVDKFQGDERNTIIFSGCVSSVAGMASNEAFYTSPNRANVAFTRAKHRLIVCCSEQLLSYLPVDPQRYSQMQLIKCLSHMCVDAGRLLFKGPIPWANGNMVRVYEGAMA